MSDNISIETIDDAPTIVEVNATVVEEVINVEITESPNAPIIEVHVDENSAQAAIDAAALAQSILDNINDVIANMPVPTLQSVSESGAITDQVLSMAGLILTSKLNIVTSFITALRSVSFQDKDGVVALISDITALSKTIASKQSAELLLSTADVVQSGGMPQISGLTIQGHTLVIGSRVVVTGYNVPSFNGIYRVSTGPIVNTGHYILARTSDANTSSALNNAIISITNGTQAGKTYRQTSVNPNIGTTAINFVEFGGSTVSNATDLLAGISKLYNAIGSEVDGGITPNAVKVGLGLKADKSKTQVILKNNFTPNTLTSNVTTETIVDNYDLGVGFLGVGESLSLYAEMVKNIGGIGTAWTFFYLSKVGNSISATDAVKIATANPAASGVGTSVVVRTFHRKSTSVLSGRIAGGTPAISDVGSINNVPLNIINAVDLSDYRFLIITSTYTGTGGGLTMQTNIILTKNPVV